MSDRQTWTPPFFRPVCYPIGDGTVIRLPLSVQDGGSCAQGGFMLKRLELVGFKSFADKTIFDFGDGITAIVGPNGSGKSNIVDAVRWIAGEQSAKSLRGGEMADVIFNGSASRRSFGVAEVTMTFDNQRRLLATEAQEVQVTRRV